MIASVPIPKLVLSSIVYHVGLKSKAPNGIITGLENS